MARLELKEILQAGSSLDGGVLSLKNIEPNSLVNLNSGETQIAAITHIKVFTNSVYIVLNADNNVKKIELTIPKTTLSCKNVLPTCEIVVNDRATITMFNLTDGSRLGLDSLEIINNKE